MDFYRYEAIEYASIDYDGDYIQSSWPNPKVELRLYNLFKETPKGYWICYGSKYGFHSPEKWVSKTSKKRFAYPTKIEAMNNFIKRNERRIKILSRQIQSCQAALSTAKNIKLFLGFRSLV